MVRVFFYFYVDILVCPEEPKFKINMISRATVTAIFTVSVIFNASCADAELLGSYLLCLMVNLAQGLPERVN